MLVASGKTGTFNLGAGLAQHPEIAQSVGVLIGLWNSLEHAAFSGLFSVLTGIHPALSAHIIYALKNSGARLDILEDSGSHVLQGTEHLNTLRDLVRSLRAALKARNFYAHSVYGVTPEGKLIAFDPTDWETKDQQVFITPESVAADLEKIVSTYNQVNMFFCRLVEWQESRRSTRNT